MINKEKLISNLDNEISNCNNNIHKSTVDWSEYKITEYDYCSSSNFYFGMREMCLKIKDLINVN
jgi:hypothetical protein